MTLEKNIRRCDILQEQKFLVVCHKKQKIGWCDNLSGSVSQYEKFASYDI